MYGSGPEVLGGLPEPDAAVVESGGLDVVRAVLARRPERFVALPRTLAEAQEVHRAIAGAGYRADGSLLQATPLRPVGEGDGLALGTGGTGALVLWGEQIV